MKYSAKKLFQTHSSSILSAKFLSFKGVDGNDVYNISSPFVLNNKEYLACRVEPRENHNSYVHLFTHDSRSESWDKLELWEPIKMEDPFHFKIQQKLYLGGVVTKELEQDGKLVWHTEVYEIDSLFNRNPVFQGPTGMKDIRFVEYPDNKIGVFTRPQGIIGNRGTIGYVEINKFSDLKNTNLYDAELISFPDDSSWEGVNQPFLISNSYVGILGHIAWMDDEGNRHYYVAANRFDRQSKSLDGWNIIAHRDLIPPGPAKRPDLVDVLFPGGVEINPSSGTCFLYLGVSDAQACIVELPIPENWK